MIADISCWRDVHGQHGLPAQIRREGTVRVQFRTGATAEQLVSADPRLRLGSSDGHSAIDERCRRAADATTAAATWWKRIAWKN